MNAVTDNAPYAGRGNTVFLRLACLSYLMGLAKSWGFQLPVQLKYWCNHDFSNEKLLVVWYCNTGIEAAVIAGLTWRETWQMIKLDQPGSATVACRKLSLLHSAVVLRYTVVGRVDDWWTSGLFCVRRLCARPGIVADSYPPCLVGPGRGWEKIDGIVFRASSAII